MTTMTPVKSLSAAGAAWWLAVASALAVCPLTPPDDCIYVDEQDPGCVPLPGGTGTSGAPFCTIQDAYDHAVAQGTNPSAVETILVRPGQYQECVTAAAFNPPCDCCSKGAEGTLGCDCPSCEAEVCAFDDFCCDIDWDFTCDAYAADLCGCCAIHSPAIGPVAGTCADDIDDRPVHLVADAWLEAGSPAPDPLDPSAFEAVATMTTITGLGSCDLAGGTPGSTLTISGTGASAEGFAITGGGASGVDVRGSVTLANLLVRDNDGELGGGIQLRTTVCAWGDVTATIARSVVRDNTADDVSEFGAGDGGGIFIVADGKEPDAHCVGGRSEVTVADSVLSGNTANNANIDLDANDSFAGGGGISAETLVVQPDGDPQDSEARIVLFGNTLLANTAFAGVDGFALGGAISATTFGAGKETIRVENNKVGPGNLAEALPFDEFSTPLGFGGGISGSVTPATLGLHEITMHGNEVFENVAEFGGGVDLLLDARDLTGGQVARLHVTENLIRNNESNRGGGGITAQLTSTRTVDQEQAPAFPSVSNPAEDVALLIRGNVLTENDAGVDLQFGGGAGALLRVEANADPDGFGPAECFPNLIGSAAADLEFVNNLVEDNFSFATFSVAGCSDNVCEDRICSLDPFCCDTEWDTFCANAANADATCLDNCGTSDCCGAVTPDEADGAGVLTRLVAKGDAAASLSVDTSTVVINASSASGLAGGVEAVAVTIPDCELDDTGRAALDIDRSIINLNDSFGVGGPPPAENDLTAAVTKSSVYDNGNNGDSLQYESTLFPGGVAPDGNLLGDPLLTGPAFAPDLCSPAYDIGHCSGEPSTICVEDDDCTAPDTCVAEGAGYVASPDINDDDAVDGVDLLRFSAAFSAEQGVDARYDADADLDRNGTVDGTDLPFIGPLFGQECVAP